MVTATGTATRWWDWTITLGRLAPFVIVLLATNVAAWFRLDAISDARADDACIAEAKIHTAMRNAFGTVAETFPDALVLGELTEAINVRFPMTVGDC